MWAVYECQGYDDSWLMVQWLVLWLVQLRSPTALKTWSVRVSSQVSFSRNFMVGGDAVIIHVPDASLVEWMPMSITNAFGLSASAFHGDHHLHTYYVLALLFAGGTLLTLRLYHKDFMCLI
jgi:hypothetical protein